MKKRDFIKTFGAIGLIPFSQNIRYGSFNKIENLLNTENLSDDDFWKLVRSQYDLHPDFINLESGYYNIIPKPTLKKQIEHIKRVNLEGSFYMRKSRFKDKSTITSELANFVGCNGKKI